MLFDKDEDGVLTFHELQQELSMIFILHINLVSIEGDASSGTETRDQRSAADGQESNAFRFARTSRDLFLSVGTRFYSDLDLLSSSLDIIFFILLKLKLVTHMN